MRKQLVKSIEEILNIEEKSILLLGDIGVFGFRNAFKNYTNRVYNIGILEQSTIGVAAGLSKCGMIPFVHTISPFIVERSLEQLKIDFGYQKLNGNFIGVGSSYDYSSLGPTHHCPSDIMILQGIPNMEIIIPGNSFEFDSLIKECYNDGNPTYYRLSETEHKQNLEIKFGKANIIKKGNKATIICFGNILDNVINATRDIDVTILYYSTFLPFDYITLKENFNENIIVIEPFYEGSTNYLITKELKNLKYNISNIGIPREFITQNGKKEEIDIYLGLDVNSLKNKIENICLL